MATEAGCAALYYAAFVYDGILGLLLLAVPGTVYTVMHETPPEHFGYVQFPAALLLVFAAMFWTVARDLQRNRNLIPYLILFKLAFASVVIGYWIAGDIPGLWKPFSIIDLLFAGAFYGSWWRTRIPRAA
ncbi:hypothetical protein HZB60_10305 [candidate division KSB1 bacterium]|nr:hypothetical protein [candidate division KSB1 bacterium]